MKRGLLIFLFIFLIGCTTEPIEEINEPVEDLTEVNEPVEVEEPPIPEPQEEEDSHDEEPSIIEEIIEKFSDRRGEPSLPSEKEIDQLPECDGKQFTVPPVDLSKVYEINPIGNLGPPGHTFPTEHSYIHFNPGGSSTETYKLSAPADITIIHVSSRKNMNEDPEDHTIYFALCKDLIGYYNHVKFLSDDFQEKLDEYECEQWNENADNSCPRNTFFEIKAGFDMGEVGRLQGNFDFGMMDLKTEHKFANPDRYGGRTPHIVCAYDYYDDPEQFFDKIIRKDENRCGIIAQDIPGTLKGNWFYDNVDATTPNDWDKHLAFVDDDFDPEIQVISIAGIFLDPQVWEIKPKNSGNIDREFSQVKPGDIYCYNGDGKILVQLTSRTELKIEHQSGSCGSSNSFKNPNIYER